MTRFEEVIDSLEEQLHDLEQIRSTTESKADENGRFIYDTIVTMIQMLHDRYAQERARRVKKQKT